METEPVLITGSEGYIAGNLISRLGEEDVEYIPYDLRNGDDVRDFDELEKKADDAELIYHLAAQVGVTQCRANPVEAFETNVLGTKNVLELGSKVVFASSFAADRPISIYGLTKLGAEKLVEEHNGVVLRFSNVYGGDNFLEEKNTVVSNFVEAKMNGDEAVIYGDGRQSRDFIHVDDVVDALIEAPSYRGFYNVCTGIQTSVLELADMVEVDYRHEPARENDIRHSGGMPSGIVDCERDLESWIRGLVK